MTIRRETKNLETQVLIDSLYKKSKETNKPFYKAIAKNLEKPNRHDFKINIEKIEKLNNIKDGTIVVVLGKLLSVGETNKKVTVYARSFSQKAQEKIKDVKTLNDLCKDTIDYKKTVILK